MSLKLHGSKGEIIFTLCILFYRIAWVLQGQSHKINYNA